MQKYLLLLLLFGACAQRSAVPEVSQSEPPAIAVTEDAMPPTPQASTENRQLATFGTGCFWCTEAIFEQQDGVIRATSGYMGGANANPTYKEVWTGTSGHAEVVQVEFDPNQVSYEALLAWFWRMHDPTTLNRQGNDVGTQYRSAIFYHSEQQKTAATAARKAAQADFLDLIVTEITEAAPFFSAEAYHQDYYANNKTQGYCRAVIAPKLDKLGLDK